MNPVLVTGVGRCGTSAVARVLHEQLGVHMGYRLPEPDRATPRGSYEDVDFRELHIAYGRGRMDRETFRERAVALLNQRAREHTPQEEVYSAWEDTTILVDNPGDRCGFKDPRACEVLDVYLETLPNAGVIVCERPFTDVLASWGRVCAGRKDDHRKEIQARSRKLEAALSDWDGDALRLDMSEHRTDAWIAERVGAFLGLTARAAT